VSAAPDPSPRRGGRGRAPTARGRMVRTACVRFVSTVLPGAGWTNAGRRRARIARGGPARHGTPVTRRKHPAATLIRCPIHGIPP
jgi:hypothetical protein